MDLLFILCLFGFIQYLIIPRISESVYFRRYSFKNDYLCNLMNVGEDNKKSKLSYQFSGIYFSLSYLYLFPFVKEYQFGLLFLSGFVFFYLMQIVFHGQDSRAKLLVHAISLISSIIFNFLLVYQMRQILNQIFLTIYLILFIINIFLIIFNLLFQKGKKEVIVIIYGKIGYILLIITPFFIIF